jgi:hypothetical protein
MPIFRLDPIEARKADPKWEATFLKGTCWVTAPFVDEARLRVGKGTMEIANGVPDHPLRTSPWLDSSLTDCREDWPAFNVPDDALVGPHGRRVCGLL